MQLGFDPVVEASAAPSGIIEAVARPEDADEWEIPAWLAPVGWTVLLMVVGFVAGFAVAFASLAPDDPLGPWPPLERYAGLGAGVGFLVGVLLAWRRSRRRARGGTGRRD